MRRLKWKQERPQGTGSQIRNWSNLPQDISESILKLLSLRDYLQFGLVCKSWRDMVTNAIASKRCLPAPQLPLLLMAGQAPDSNFTYACFFDLSKQKLINPKRPLFGRRQYCISFIEGWFFMLENFLYTRPEYSSQLFLFNPVSGDRIVLPSQIEVSGKRLQLYKQPQFIKVVASSSPDSKDCIIVGLLESFCHLAVYKLDNKFWTMIEAKKDMVFMDLEIIGKTLYVLVDDGDGESTIFYELENANDPKLNMLVSLEHKPDRRVGTGQGDDIEYVTDTEFTYLAKHNVSGDLFMIRMLVDYACNNDDTIRVRHIVFINDYVIPPRPKEFRVWKLDKSNHHWLELRDLDDRLLFFRGNGSSIVISNTSLSEPEEFIKGNCVYFLSSSSEDTERGSLQIEIGRFCMTDRTLQLFRPSDLSGANEAMMSNSFWFIPKLF